MPYTTHGHWYGPGEPTLPGPRVIAKCFGPTSPLCAVCYAEAATEPMKPEDVPIELRKLAVEAMTANDALPEDDRDMTPDHILAAVLAAHKRLVRIELVAAGWETPAQVEQFAADRDRFADLLSWQIDLHRSRPNHGNLDRRGCQGCQQFAAIREHPAIVAAREERIRATAEALVSGNYLACPAPEDRIDGGEA